MSQIRVYLKDGKSLVKNKEISSKLKKNKLIVIWKNWLGK